MDENKTTYEIEQRSLTGGKPAGQTTLDGALLRDDGGEEDR